MNPTTIEFWRIGAEAGTSGAAALIKLWLDSRRLEKVRILRANGTRVEVGSGTPEQIASILHSVDE